MEQQLARHAGNDGSLENKVKMEYECQLEDSERLDPIKKKCKVCHCGWSL